MSESSRAGALLFLATVIGSLAFTLWWNQRNRGARATVFGTVRDVAGAPVVNALVTLGGLATYSNSAGAFIFSGMAAGTYIGSVTHSGYDTIEFQVTLAAGENDMPVVMEAVA